MKHYHWLFFFLPMIILQIPVYAQDATEIVRRADEKMRGLTSYVEMTMEVVRPDWSRKTTMKSWSKGTDLALILLTEPARDKGTAFLKRKTEVWNWLPSVEQVIKIPPSMMMQSWMGSDFTNDDLVKQSSIVVDYTHKIVGDSTIEGRSCYKIELIPKPDAPVVWGKVLLWVSEEDYLELRVEFFDEDDELVNVMTALSVKMMGGRLIPSVLTMIPVDKPEHRTVLTYHHAEFDKKIKDSFFSEQNMKRVR